VFFPLEIAIASLLALIFSAYILVGGFIWGAGYQPVPKKSLLRMIELSSPSERTNVYDLGSGFGRIVIEVARRTGARCTGVEIDPVKCFWASWAVRRNGFQERVRIIRSNLLEADISSADVVFVFLWSRIMERLKEKITSEMKPGSLVVSYWHRFRGWEPEASDEKLRVYLYRVPHTASHSQS